MSSAEAEVRRLREALVLACRELARRKLERWRDATGEDFNDDMVRLAAADEMREIMRRVVRAAGNAVGSIPARTPRGKGEATGHD